jgi:2'-5' RNA ligase
MLNRDLPSNDAPRLWRDDDPVDDFNEVPADRIFFAVKPPPATASSIARLTRYLRDKHRLAGMSIRPDCLHASLFLAGYHGQMPPGMLAALSEAASTVRMAPFRVSFDWVESFRHRRRRPLVLRGDDGTDGLIWLYDRLVSATLDINGARPSARSDITPHVTLLYDEKAIREEPVEDISWTVSEFVLVRSLYGQSRHITLGRFTLRG